jgi:hypothetical protein
LRQASIWCLALPLTVKDYRLSKTLSRPVLERFLSRAIAMEGLLNGRGDLRDNIRMLQNVGAKYIARSLCLWDGEAKLFQNLERATLQFPQARAIRSIWTTASDAIYP